MITMKDIAKQAGVSVSTVSYVLNDKGNISPKTREKILKVAAEINYNKNLIASSLKTKKTQVIGLIIPNIANTFFADIIRGVEDIAHKEGYSVILCNSDENKEKEKKYTQMLLAKEVDGLIFIGTGKTDSILSDMPDTPIVVVDRFIGEDVSSVLVNNVYGGYLATKHLIDKGERDIYLITGALTISTFFDRMTGYVQALRENNIEYDGNKVIQCPVNSQGGFDAVEELYEKGIEPKALFLASDLQAFGAIRVITERNRTIPGDVKIVGYDDIPTSFYITPALTTIRQPRHTMGSTAAKILIDKINRNEEENVQIVLEPKIIVRSTT